MIVTTSTIRRRWPWLAICPVLFIAATGCTSALTSAYLKGLPWDGAEGASASLPPEPEDLAESDPSAGADGEAAGDDRSAADDDEKRRAAAIDEAVARLTRLGTLDEAAAAALVATLRGTQQQDWPVVIAEFSAALAAASEPVAGPAASMPVAGPRSVGSKALADDAETTAKVAADTAPAAEPPAAASPPGLRITNACFASRVQAWGVVERFPESRFLPGREVIVYFELDGLSAEPSAAGHTTCIDTVLRLVDGEGAALHEWNFEPIEETCAGRRRDYFARYVVRIPGDLKTGDCRLELRVTDALADASAAATLPLEIVAAGADAG